MLGLRAGRWSRGTRSKQLSLGGRQGPLSLSRVLALEGQGRPCLTLTVGEGAGEGSTLTGARKTEATAQRPPALLPTPVSTTLPSSQALGPHQCVQFQVSTVPGGSSRACSSRGRVRPQGKERWEQGQAAGEMHVPLCSS